MRGRTVSQALTGAALAAAAVLAGPSVASADPPGPTDFESTVVAIEPRVDGVDVDIIGGDAFFELTVAPGVSVAVGGYQGEPYLEFAPTGEVRENRNSPTYFASRSKQGAAVPAGVTADSVPDWAVVATDGRYAWHDHRTHWMGATPQGARGRIVARGTVPVAVDGAPVTVRVETTWLPSASPVPALAGAAIGAALGAGYVVSRRRRGLLADAVLGGAAGVALLVGVTQYLSVPAVTGPSPLGWVVPATAIVATGVGALLARRPSSTVFVLGAHALAGVELLIWAVGRRSGLLAAILPTDAPYWLDRSATTAVAIVGAAAAGLALVRLVELVTRPAGASATTQRPART